jgi:hypothetical protein
MRRALRVLGSRRLDGRTAVAREVEAWKAAVRADLGGDLTRAQETLLDAAATTALLVSSIDAWIAQQPTVIAARKRALLPVVLQRQQLVDSLGRQLERLGLSRRAKPVDLDAYVASRGGTT